MRRSITDDEQAGAVEPFEDPALYDWEYRRRRSDADFYRTLAGERGGPILDLGCGTGRITFPMVRDGHRVLGVDLSAAMLARATKKLRRMSRPVANRCLLIRSDFRRLAVRGRFPFAVAAFHTIQHLIDDADLMVFLRQVRRLIGPDGWFAFDLFFPHPRLLARPPHRKFDRTVFHHPVTGQKLAYTFAHRLDDNRRALHMRFGYQRLAENGAPVGRERVIRLCHRQLAPAEVAALLRRAGLKIIGRWDGFDNEPLKDGEEFDSEQHIYLCTPIRRPGAARTRARRR